MQDAFEPPSRCALTSGGRQRHQATIRGHTAIADPSIAASATADLAGRPRSVVALRLSDVTEIVSAHGSSDNRLVPGAPRKLQLSASATL